MNIISWNVNGLRAVEKKEALAPFIETYKPDILLFQETKAQVDQLTPFQKKYPAYIQYYNAAEKKGYSGTAVWVKKETQTQPLSFYTGMPNFNDTEGRIARIDIGDTLCILGIYFPNGGKSPDAWKEKLVFYDRFLDFINALRKEGRHVIWGGDVNCAHQEIDLARPKENQNSIGFLPEERAWVSRVIAEGWVDVFRSRYPNRTDVYSWWHLISKARARNVGWRIDYLFVDKTLAPKVKDITYLTDHQGSDHCPVQLTLDSVL